MMAISAEASFHGVTKISAHSTYTWGAPLILTMEGKDGIPSRLIVFTDNEALTQALIDAINGAAAAKSEAA